MICKIPAWQLFVRVVELNSSMGSTKEGIGPGMQNWAEAQLYSTRRGVREAVENQWPWNWTKIFSKCFKASLQFRTVTSFKCLTMLLSRLSNRSNIKIKPFSFQWTVSTEVAQQFSYLKKYHFLIIKFHFILQLCLQSRCKIIKIVKTKPTCLERTRWWFPTDWEGLDGFRLNNRSAKARMSGRNS